MSLDALAASVDTLAFCAFALAAVVGVVAKFVFGMDSIFGIPLNLSNFKFEPDHDID